MTSPANQDRVSVLPPSVHLDLAYQDELTGLFNRRVLDLIERDHWDELIQQDGHLSLVMIDLDLFKEVNDTYGHLAGDRVLQATARALIENFRQADILVRYGGDEFLVLLPAAGEIEAEALAERARETLVAQTHTVDDEDSTPIEVPISFSLGRATYPNDGYSVRELLETADRRLYLDKGQRRSAKRPVGRMLLLLVLLGLLVALAWSLRQEAAEPIPVVQIAPAVRIDTGEAEVLRAQIRRLEAQVAELRSALAEAPASADAGAAGRIHELEATIDSLRESLTEPSDLQRVPQIEFPDEPPPVTTGEPGAGIEPGLADPGVPSASGVEGPAAASSIDREPIPVHFEAPKLRYLETPTFPQRALELRREATVRFEVVVSVEGNVVAATPLEGEVGFGFDEAARKAALGARYSPGLRNGVPTQMVTRLAIEFRLD